MTQPSFCLKHQQVYQAGGRCAECAAEDGRTLEPPTTYVTKPVRTAKDPQPAAPPAKTESKKPGDVVTKSEEAS